jgi:hypothetical protein
MVIRLGQLIGALRMPKPSHQIPIGLALFYLAGVPGHAALDDNAKGKPLRNPQALTEGTEEPKSGPTASSPPKPRTPNTPKLPKPGIGPKGIPPLPWA